MTEINMKCPCCNDRKFTESEVKVASLITTIESQKQQIRALKEESLKVMEFHKHNLNLQKREIDSLKAITELAVKGLTQISKSYEYDWNVYVDMASDTLAEIEKLSNE